MRIAASCVLQGGQLQAHDAPWRATSGSKRMTLAKRTIKSPVPVESATLHALNAALADCAASVYCLNLRAQAKPTHQHPRSRGRRGAWWERTPEPSPSPS